METSNPETPEPYPNERRAHPRRPCSAEAKIAPYTLGMSLSSLQFQPVTMNDISGGGLSYWSNEWPKYVELVFPLRDHGGEGLVLASVRKLEKIDDRTLVRCQFIRRLNDEG